MARHRWVVQGGWRYALAAVALVGVGALVLSIANLPYFGGRNAPRGPGTLLAANHSELSTNNRLADRRTMVAGDRFVVIGAADGRYPALGARIRGEMGGFWSAPIKLLDGLWFSTEGKWLGPATRTTSGPGFVRSELPTRDGVHVSRVDFVPDGHRAALIGLTFMSQSPKTVNLTVDAHSELLSAYPWSNATPDPADANLPDAASYVDEALVFRDVGASPGNGGTHDWAAVVASTLTPRGGRLGSDFRGPQDPAVRCPASGFGGDSPAERCDDTAYGRGAGGQLRYSVKLRADVANTVWFAVAGSDRGLDAAHTEQRRALADPEGLFASKFAARRELASQTMVDLPGDRLLERSVEWSKQNLADSVQEARRLQLRNTARGTAFGPATGSVAKARWFGAGFPDDPGLSATDGEYTAFAAVAAGQFEPAEAHLRALREVSDKVNGGSGKVVHEVTSDGAVYSGSNSDPGNTDETARFPSAVALIWRWTGDNKFRDEMYDFTVRNMRYVVQSVDADSDGWPEGVASVDRPGMGQEKLDNAVYAIRGLRDLQDLAISRRDQRTADWAATRAEELEQEFEDVWWLGGSTNQYADSLSNPTGQRIFQRLWTGLTPLEAVLVRSGRLDRPVASVEHARLALDGREKDCYSGPDGLFHTGTGGTSASGGNRGSVCDRAVSVTAAERRAYTIDTAVMAVAEGNYGRLGTGQQQRYTAASARVQLNSDRWEMPGSMPEIAPGGDYGSNLDKPFTERAAVLRAWGTYGVLWPVVHHQLGIDPDMGRDRLSVVPQVPDGQDTIGGRNIRIGGDGSIDVTATRNGSSVTTRVTRRAQVAMTFGAVLPVGKAVRSVRLDGKQVPYQAQYTSRGVEVVVEVEKGEGVNEILIRFK